MNPAFQAELARRRAALAARRQVDFQPPAFDRPLFIVSAPRAGSSLLFETLSLFPDLWTIGEESHELMEGIPALHPAANGYASNRLTADDATLEVAAELHDRFARQLRDREKRHLIDLPPEARPARLRLLEKTPKNALRIPFLAALYPDARFLFLYREPAGNISSIVEGWESRRFIAYRSLPDGGEPWSFLLTPGWEEVRDRPLAEIAAHQWRVANETIVADLAGIPAAWLLVRYTELIDAPRSVIGQIAAFADLAWDEIVEQRLSRPLPPSRMTVSPPAREKWRRREVELTAVLPGTEAAARSVAALAADTD